MEQTEKVDLSKIQPGTTIDVNNQIYLLGNPVISAETFTQLINQIKHYSANTAVVVLIPDDTCSISADVQQQVQNYIVNHVQSATPDTRKLVSKHLVENITGQEIGMYSYGDVDLAAIWYLTRKHASCVSKYNTLSAELSVLIQKQNQGTLTEEEQARGDLVYNTLLPKAQKECQKAFDELTEQQRKYNQATQAAFNRTSVRSESDTTIISTASESPKHIPVSVADASVTQVSADADTKPTVSETVKAKAPLVPETVSVDDALKIITSKWLDQRKYCMPLHLAQSFAEQPAYAMYSMYQQPVAGYTLVPPALLIMFRIKMYSPDLPIVFTTAGEFMRIGANNHSIYDLDYWYPKPDEL